MPRRRALGMLGVTLAGLATGGSATGARRPFGTRQSSGCGTGYKVCSPGSNACRATCCPTHTTCSIGPKDPKNGCAISDGCCDPCNPQRSTPDGKGGCKPGQAPSYCPCKPGQKPCGKNKQCCGPDEECLRWKFGAGGTNVYETCLKKCPPGSRRCSLGDGVSDVDCCPNGQNCCAGVCCTSDAICIRALSGDGGFARLCKRRCKAPQVRCNFVCCNPEQRAYRKLKNGRVRCLCVRDQ